MRTVKARLAKLLKCRNVEREVESELLFHLELRTEKNLRQGMTLEEAEREAAQRFGDFERIKNQCAEISNRSRPLMRALKSFLIAIFLAGVLTRALGADIYSRQIGDMLMMIAALGGLLLHLRSLRFYRFPHKDADSSPLGLSNPEQAPVAASTRKGRTPLERVLSDD